jgi:type III pantothenate kinase
MNLIIDIGNTVAKIAVFDGLEMLEQLYDSNETLSRLNEIYLRYSPEHAAVVSVIKLSDVAKDVLNALPIPVLYVDNHTPLPIQNLYETPETLGFDRIAAVVGAYDRFPHHDILVIDSGTCITYEFINAKGEYLGGNISLGSTMRFKALNHYTDLLPLLNVSGRVVDFGVDTETAIRAGVLKGIEFEMAGYIHMLRMQYPTLLVFLTGGKRFQFESDFRNSIFIDKFLVLKGLNCILNYNIALKKGELA